jgi:general stress protein 26
MTDNPDVRTELNVANQIMTAAGCGSIITLDESGQASSRPVRTLVSDENFTRITIPTDANSRKTHHVRINPNIVLSYVDTPSRGYVTMIGKAMLVDSQEEKRAAWLEPFTAFWPDGPETEEYLLIVFTPARIEMRSYTQGVAESPTRWTPEVLLRTDDGGWQVSD